MTVFPPSGSTYDMLLGGHFGDTGTVVTDDRTGVVFDDAKRSKMWTSFLQFIGKPTNYNPETDLALNATTYDVLKSTEVWQAYLGQQGLLSNFDPDIPPNNPPEKGSFYWFEYLKSQNLSFYYNPDLDPNLTPVQAAQFIADFETFALSKISLFHINFLAFAAIYQTEKKLKLETQFLQFIQGNLLCLQTEGIMLQSPDEIKKRLIMFETFETLLKMLISLQNTIGVVGRNLIFYGKWQEQYTNMLTRVPIYTGGISSLPKVIPPADFFVPNTANLKDISEIQFDNFTFGYNDISVEDISKWWEDTASETDQKTLRIVGPVTIDVFGSQMPEFVIHIQPPLSDGTEGLFFIAARPDSGEPGFLLRYPPFNNPNENPGPTANDFKQAFAELWTNNTTQTIVNNQGFEDRADLFYTNAHYGSAGTDPASIDYTVMQIPWLHTFSVKDATGPDKDRNDFESKARGEINAKLQQYIENIRSRRQLVQNAAKQIESTLSQSKESISQQANLLTSILDSLKSLIGAIFR